MAVMIQAGAAACATLSLFAIASKIEAANPAGQTGGTARFNTWYAVVVTLLQSALGPVAGIETAYLANRLGHPFLPLPAHGWKMALSVLVLLLSKDFIDYWFHRAQHRFPALWAMHSFHHSDHAMNVTTSQRHFWLERVLSVLVLYVPIGLVFSFSRTTALLFAAGAMFFSLFPHMNLRVEFKRFSWAALGPQLHRLHHSSRPEDYNANYAGMFPVLDVMFGTYKQPVAGDFPPTGLGGSCHPTMLQTIAWPLREKLQDADDDPIHVSASLLFPD